MHQPEYRDMSSGEYVLPWTYLHVIKDYVDMAAHLEAHPGARAVINFAPVLLDQIEDYAEQIDNFLTNTTPLRDPLLRALAATDMPLNTDDRLALIHSCLRTNRHRSIERYQPYHKIAEMADWLVENPQFLPYAAPQFFADLLVWYHLAWIGETVKHTDLRIKRLLNRESAYGLEERLELFSVIGELLENVLGRYKKLAKSGQIELSMTPYAHPIMPLLLDIHSAREAMPDAPLPQLNQYPGGEERVRWHIEKGLETFQRVFGCRPVGCWPSEGAVSDATVKILDDSGFRWAASGQNVLSNSLSAANLHVEHRHRPYQLENTSIQCFFRDDGLSDLIGFKYSSWHGDDAVADLVNHLENIANNQHHRGVIAIIMDGENAWEHYPN
ncbi:MAG TPA: glycoside hydrolase, partial [Crenotrichaceae bacterium]|nr:glycoside hydrolase [Crenotrichaceae bacterium]